eukprot:CAMPEP_0116563744 /NCGR_PEP_ID=MMETSP0397-20121206/12908_1 /TAXON_ID=216820 /ORGANISM="Cyclophora tenuis, Strain ECT3854" /LENGTH=246 /DNA_ID=CAMNT_0004090231 /DNA_START=570 /DNA_END=1311 /DNA_ORIENTATION=-
MTNSINTTSTSTDATYIHTTNTTNTTATTNSITKPYLQTFQTAQELHQLKQQQQDPPLDTLVVHCESCGSCSNSHDIAIYYDTRNTLTETTVQCAKQSLIWGRRTANKCMERSVGFTQPCQYCWVENILCDLKYCVFICMWSRLFVLAAAKSSVAGGKDGAAPRELTPCTKCDEKRCGPQFIQCAGANRRRSGIVSDIQRDDAHEVCTDIHHPFWWQDAYIQQSFQDIMAANNAAHEEQHKLLRAR